LGAKLQRFNPPPEALIRNHAKMKLTGYHMKQLVRIVFFLIAFHGGVRWLRSQTPPPREMNLVVVEGEGQSNNIGQHARRPPLVRVEDENHRPIVGAAVIFTLPTEGATGDFGNGSKTFTTITDSQGEAAGKGLKLNQLPGKLPIYVNASYRGLTAKATITEYVVAPPGAKVGGGGGSGKLILVLAIIGAAAAGGAYYATHRGGAAAPVTTVVAAPTPIGITVGTGTIAGGN
jgi:hypothetical protein